MKIRCFCIVLIVSGALLTEVNNNRSLSGDNLLVVNNLQSSKCFECRPLGRHILDYPILFKVTQKTTPATFIEWRNMFGNKVANSFFPFFHLTNIDWFIAR